VEGVANVNENTERKLDGHKLIWTIARGRNIKFGQWLANRNNRAWAEQIPITSAILLEWDSRRGGSRELVQIEIDGSDQFYHYDESGEKLVLRNDGQTLVFSANLPPSVARPESEREERGGDEMNANVEREGTTKSKRFFRHVRSFTGAVFWAVAVPLALGAFVAHGLDFSDNLIRNLSAGKRVLLTAICGCGLMSFSIGAAYTYRLIREFVLGKE
jgi:hypothetical protein